MSCHPRSSDRRRISPKIHGKAEKAQDNPATISPIRTINPQDVDISEELPRAAPLKILATVSPRC